MSAINVKKLVANFESQLIFTNPQNSSKPPLATKVVMSTAPTAAVKPVAIPLSTPKAIVVLSNTTLPLATKVVTSTIPPAAVKPKVTPSPGPKAVALSPSAASALAKKVVPLAAPTVAVKPKVTPSLASKAAPTSNTALAPLKPVPVVAAKKSLAVSSLTSKAAPTSNTALAPLKPVPAVAAKKSLAAFSSTSKAVFTSDAVQTSLKTKSSVVVNPIAPKVVQVGKVSKESSTQVVQKSLRFNLSDFDAILAKGDKAAVVEYMRQLEDVNAESKGMTPLLAAIYHGFEDIVQQLLVRGARINWSEQFLFLNHEDVFLKRASYLHFALLGSLAGFKEYSPAIVRVLLTNGIDLFAKDYYGDTALTLCLQRIFYMDEQLVWDKV